MTAPSDVWKKHPGIVWSNRQASDSVRIRAALLKARFPVLLDFAVAFGPDQLEQEWKVLVNDPDTVAESRRVEADVSRILKNIRRGYEQARA